MSPRSSTRVTSRSLRLTRTLHPLTLPAGLRVEPAGSASLHAPDDDASLLAAFPPSLAQEASEPPALLELRGARCIAGGATDTDEPVIAGRLRGRSGRAVRGGGLLDHATRRLTPDQRAALPARLRIDGAVHVLDLRGRSAVNYFHLLVDALANRWLHQLHEPGSDADDQLMLLPSGSAPWFHEVLELAGVTRLVAPAQARRIEAARFLVPMRSFGSRRLPSWTVTALREVGGGIPADALPVGGAPAGPRLHISRADATRRRVVGEDALAARLAERGFQTVVLDGMPVAEQRARFAAAELIVAPHGAALTNLAWARPGATVVELLPVERPNLVYYRLARQAGVGYEGLICRGDTAGGRPDGHGDLVVDVERLCRIVDRVSEGRSG
jgi:capsular polysaccharide biosynthesis protein